MDMFGLFCPRIGINLHFIIQERSQLLSVRLSFSRGSSACFHPRCSDDARTSVGQPGSIAHSPSTKAADQAELISKLHPLILQHLPRQLADVPSAWECKDFGRSWSPSVAGSTSKRCATSALRSVSTASQHQGWKRTVHHAGSPYKTHSAKVHVLMQRANLGECVGITSQMHPSGWSNSSRRCATRRATSCATPTCAVSSAASASEIRCHGQSANIIVHWSEHLPCTGSVQLQQAMPTWYT